MHGSCCIQGKIRTASPLSGGLLPFERTFATSRLVTAPNGCGDDLLIPTPAAPQNCCCSANKLNVNCHLQNAAVRWA